MSKGTLQTNWTGAITGDKALRAAVERADRILVEELGRSVGVVTADWQVVTDSAGRRLLQLTLTDLPSKGQVVARFSSAELANEERLVADLRRLWGDLLQIRSHRQLEELLRDDSPSEK